MTDNFGAEGGFHRQDYYHSDVRIIVLIHFGIDFTYSNLTSCITL